MKTWVSLFDLSQSEGERVHPIREARAIYDSVFPPCDPVREHRDKASASHGRVGAGVHRGEGADHDRDHVVDPLAYEFGTIC
jgi:hypothetical protein